MIIFQTLNKELKNKLISTKSNLEEKEEANRILKENIDNKNSEISQLNKKVEEFENMKKLYESFNSIVKEFGEDCGKEIDYKEIVKKHIKQDGEKTLSIYVYNLHMRVKCFKEECEKCKNSILIFFIY